MTDLVGGCLTVLPPEDVHIFFSMVISFVFEGGQFESHFIFMAGESEQIS